MEINEILYKDRDPALALSETNASAGCLLWLGVFFVLVSISAYGACLIYGNEDQIFPATICFITSILILGYYAIKGGLKGDARPESERLFAPRKNYRSAIWNNIMAFIFLGSFFWLFYEVTAESLVARGIVITLIVLGVTGITYSMIKAQKAFRTNKVFGDSRIEVLPSPAYLGAPVTIEFYNQNLFKHTGEVTVCLRNIQERWVQEEDKELRRKTFLVYQEEKTVPVQEGRVEIKFELPKIGGRATDYLLKAPCYWELEMAKTSIGYYCRFFFDVQ